MRTTISIDEDLMHDLMRAEKGASRSEAVRRAISAHVRRRQIEAFKRLAGSHAVDLDWREMERIEMEDAERMNKKWDKVWRARKR